VAGERAQEQSTGTGEELPAPVRIEVHGPYFLTTTSICITDECRVQMK
jgi:hypothetical protein